MSRDLCTFCDVPKNDIINSMPIKYKPCKDARRTQTFIRCYLISSQLRQYNRDVMWFNPLSGNQHAYRECSHLWVANKRVCFWVPCKLKWMWNFDGRTLCSSSMKLACTRPCRQVAISKCRPTWKVFYQFIRLISIRAAKRNKLQRKLPRFCCSSDSQSTRAGKSVRIGVENERIYSMHLQFVGTIRCACTLRSIQWIEKKTIAAVQL